MNAFTQILIILVYITSKRNSLTLSDKAKILNYVLKYKKFTK